MIIKRLSMNRLKEYWMRRLPDRESEIERFSMIGLTHQDHKLAKLEIICACSLMLESKTPYEVNQALDRLRNESTTLFFDELFFDEIDKTIAGMERAGMRSEARKLRRRIKKCKSACWHKAAEKGIQQ